MKQENYQKENIDAELEALLVEMRDVPPRNPAKAARTKGQYLVKVRESLQNKENLRKPRIIQQVKEYLNMNNQGLKRLAIALSIFAMLVVMLFGGIGVTAVAASNALPGDGLYGVKTGIEQVRVQLASEEGKKVQLNIAYAQRRLNEIEKLIAAGRLEDLGVAVSTYEAYIQRALSGLEANRQNGGYSDPMLYSQIAASLESYASALEAFSNQLVGSGTRPFDEVIRFSKSAGTYRGEIEFVGPVETINNDAWVISGLDVNITSVTEIDDGIQLNENVKVEGWVDAEGVIYAKEIEKEGDDNGFGFDDDDDELLGVVNDIQESYWMINGLRFELTSTTEIDEEIAVGDFVEVEFYRNESGDYILLEIDLAIDDDMDDMDDDDDMDDMDEDDDMDDMDNYDDMDDMDDSDDDDDMDDDFEDDDMDDDFEDDDMDDDFEDDDYDFDDGDDDDDDEDDDFDDDEDDDDGDEDDDDD